MDNINITGDQQESRECRLHNNSSLPRLNPFSTPRRESKRRRPTPRQPRLEAPEAATTLEAPEEIKAAKNDDDDGLNDGLNDKYKLCERFKKCSIPLLDVRIDGPQAKILKINAMKSPEQTDLESLITIKYLQEFCKPGGGILTMDFCTLGTSFIGECSDLILLSLHQTKNEEKRRSLLELQLLTL